MSDTVLLLTTELGIGGAEQVVFELATRLPEHGFAARVAALDGRGATGDRLREAGVEVLDLGVRHAWQLAAAVRRVRVAVARQRPALVHAHLFHAGLVARLAGRSCAAPLVETLHIAEQRFRPWRFWLDRLTDAACRARVAVSEAVARFQARRTGLSRTRFTVIPNGVDLGRFRPRGSKGPLRRELGLPDGPEPLVGALGRFDPQKGLDVYLEAVGRLCAEGTGAGFLLAGYGARERALRARAAALGLGDRLHVMVPCRAPAELLGALDLLAFPSRYEGQGLVLVEAMASGVPAVASALPAVQEVVGRSEAARLVPPEDPAALAEGLRELLADAEERRRRGLAGRRRAEGSFDVATMVARHAELYRELIGGADAP